MKKKLLIGIIAGVVVIAAAIVGIVLASQNKDKGCTHNNLVQLEEVKPTCQTTGLSQGEKCGDCGEITIAQTVLDKIPCSEGSWIIDKQVSHTEDGREHTECTMCGKLINEKILEAGNKKLEYTLLEDGTYAVTAQGACTDKELVIPSEYNGKPVTVIGCDAFYYAQITSIVIPDSVTVIENRAFKYASALTSITFGNSVQSIGEEAFLGCTSIESIVLPDSLESIGVSAFFGCGLLKNINIPEGVTSIPETAFKRCYSLESIVLPDSVESLGIEAFSECSKLTTVNIGSSMMSIEVYAFGYCPLLTTINYNGTTSQWNSIGKGYQWIDRDQEYVINTLD